MESRPQSSKQSKEKDQEHRAHLEKAYFEHLFENSLEAIVMTDNDGVVVRVNCEFTRMFGWEAGESVGKLIDELVAPGNRDIHALVNTKKMTSGEPISGEAVRWRKDGSPITVSLLGSPIIIEGEQLGVYAIYRDITEKKRAQKALLREKAHFEHLFNSSPEAIVLTENDGRVIRANDAFTRLFGFGLEEVIDEPLDPLISRGGEYDEARGNTRQVAEGASVAFETIRWHKDGSPIEVSVMGTPVNVKGGQVAVYAIYRDISERKRAERAMKESEKKYRSIFESFQDIYYRTDMAGTITAVSPSVKAVGGYETEEILGRSVSDLYPDPLEREGFIKILQEKGVVNDYELKLSARWGGDIDVSVNSHLVMDDENNPVGVEGVVRDVSQRKEQEQELARAMEVAEEANRSKSEFLANMSHEIRTPMNAILGFTEILEDKIEDDEQKGFLSAISSSGKTLLRLINDILDLSKIESGKLEIEYQAVNPHAIFTEIEQIFAWKVKEKGIDFRVDIDPTLPKSLLLDELRLRQILLNLVGNAVKFTDKGSVQLAVNKVFHEGQRSTLDLIFSVKDTGIGISKENLQSIFDAFKQQKGQNVKYGGTGLGLAISKRLVGMMNGEISVESVPGEGACFLVRLKGVRVASVVDPGSLELETDQHKKHEGVSFEPARILVVDDVATNRLLVRSFLDIPGFEILEAENGRVAVDTVRREQPNLVLMDMKMPVMDGYKATKLIKTEERIKHIPVVALTASAMKKDEYKIFEAGCDGYLRKPVSRQELTDELARHLPHTKEEPLEKSGQIGSDDLQQEAVVLSTETLARLGELLALLNGEHMVLWKQVKEKNFIDDIAGFGQGCAGLGEEFAVVSLQEYGKDIHSAVQSFDIEKLNSLMGRYPDIVGGLQALDRGKGGETG